MTNGQMIYLAVCAAIAGAIIWVRYLKDRPLRRPWHRTHDDRPPDRPHSHGHHSHGGHWKKVAMWVGIVFATIAILYFIGTNGDSKPEEAAAPKAAATKAAPAEKETTPKGPEVIEGDKPLTAPFKPKQRVWVYVPEGYVLYTDPRMETGFLAMQCLYNLKDDPPGRDATGRAWEKKWPCPSARWASIESTIGIDIPVRYHFRRIEERRSLFRLLG